MFVASKAILLHKTKYGDSGLILKMYTEKFGTQTFIVKGVASPKSRGKLALFSPLAMLELQFDDRKLNQLMYLKEVTCYHQYKVIPFDMVRSGVLMFYCELIYKLLYDAGADGRLYSFLEKELCDLDTDVELRPDCNLWFMLRLAEVLGFAPANNYSEKCCFFCPEQSSFQTIFMKDEDAFSEEASAVLSKMLTEEEVPVPSKKTRNELLQGLISYFKIHNTHIREIESVRILGEMMRSGN